MKGATCCNSHFLPLGVSKEVVSQLTIKEWLLIYMAYLFQAVKDDPFVVASIVMFINVQTAKL